jgi:hypothetical protein
MNNYKSTPCLPTGKGEKKRKKVISSFNSMVVMFGMLMMLCQHGDGPSIV